MILTWHKSLFAILLCLNWVIDICIPLLITRGIGDYWTKRAKLIQEEENLSFGGDLILNENELLANHTLMSAKLKEIEEGFIDQSKFLPEANFLIVKEKIKNSRVFKIIQKLPKGALLHIHDLGSVSQEYVLMNLTYRPNLYACNSKGSLKLMFFSKPNDDCNWELLSVLRKNSTKENEINTQMQQQMSMYNANPAEAYPDSYKAWIKFQSLFQFLFPFISYKPVFEDYYYQILKELYDDKVLYLELRTILPDLYDLSGRVYTSVEVIQILKDVTDKFIENHPDFVGAKIIYAPPRNINRVQLKERLKVARELKAAYPSFIAGFDLVGHEEKGSPLSDFADQLKILGEEMSLFFHAGETDWYGLTTDQNLIDAVLLNAKRIGHGYALLKHPKVMEIVKAQNIAIEVNPISNQVLGLVGDLRNHPASVFFAQNYPVVVSSDDPGLWGAKSLSYDFYETFMGIMSRSSDLRALKKLATNSILYSVMNDEEKLKSFEIFEKQWKQFLLDIADMDETNSRIYSNEISEF